MRRVSPLIPVVAALVLVAGGCRGAEPQATEAPGPASCDERTGGSPENTPDFVDVEVASEEGVDRVTFRFRPREGAADVPPVHFVRFEEALITDPEGAPADVAGDEFVLVIFQAFGVELEGEEPVEIYTGPREFTPGFPTVLEVEQLGDFEATISWGIGLSRRACFVVEASPTELTLEFPAS